MKVFIQQHTDASSSISTEDEFVDDIVIASLEESIVDKFIEESSIVLGESYLYDNNYQYYTKKYIELV